MDWKEILTEDGLRMEGPEVGSASSLASSAIQVGRPVISEREALAQVTESPTETVGLDDEPVEIAYSLESKVSSRFLRLLIFAFLLFLGYTLASEPRSHPDNFFHLASRQLIAYGILFGVTAILWDFSYRSSKVLCRIKINRGGIEFSPGWLIGWSWELLNRTNRSWDDLQSIELINSPQPENLETLKWRDSPVRNLKKLTFATEVGPKLYLDYASGGTASISLNKLTKSQAKRLFGALEKWTQSNKLSSKAMRLREALLCDVDDLSHTELWNSDLELRHASTNFVPLSPGAKLQDGRLTVLTEIATGGFSAVYLVEDKNGGKFALKEAVLPQDMSEQSQEKCRQSFQREARILMKIDHPQIVRVCDCFVERRRDYLVLEYICGKSLRQTVLSGGPLLEMPTISIVLQVVDILAHLHSLEVPIVHRDLTPDNLVLNDQGKVVLIDFGAANEYLGTATSTMIGKQAYIAPEQFRGKAQPQSDIYALGGTIFFLTTATEPVALSCSSPGAFIPVSARLNEIVERCTQLNPGDRYPDVAALRTDLVQLAESSWGAHRR